ncbi:hypothetical protein SZ51_08740 [Brachyspira hyodysenteriae]|uniref:hypothetical protein n=1 Tax=Brachyspira hyodysenteriae TaxID=159 RepID=UPI00063DD4A4|nr:hypothetical protein [Brachyspira hyodysenteriae]KLI37563.1 hypothetical protein SZ51_08740 [Brachyspira hyodysenteriae]
MITTPNTNSLTNKIIKNKWPHYNAEHLYYFNLKSMEKLSNITGFKILYSSRLTKNMNFKYMYYQFKEHNNTFFKLINIFDKIPIINNMSLNISTGDSIFILREDRNV